MATKEELLAKKEKLEKELFDIEEALRDKCYVAAVDFASMYPSIIRLLNSGIETLVGFLDDDPIAYRRVGSSKIVTQKAQESAQMLKTKYKDSRFARFVGKKEERFALRKAIYDGELDDADIEEITETPFERYFLARLGIYDPDEITVKFRGETYTVNEFYNYLQENDLVVSGAGGVFSKKVQGLIPSYLEFLFKERKKVKKEMLAHHHWVELLQKYKYAAKEDGLF